VVDLQEAAYITLNKRKGLDFLKIHARQKPNMNFEVFYFLIKSLLFLNCIFYNGNHDFRNKKNYNNNTIPLSFKFKLMNIAGPKKILFSLVLHSIRVERNRREQMTSVKRRKKLTFAFTFGLLHWQSKQPFSSD